MDLQEFCTARPFLYHLTDKENIDQILRDGILLSTNNIANAAFNNAKDAKAFLRAKRNSSEMLIVDRKKYKIRDQQPISLPVLERSLTGGIKSGDFLELLNNRVFWWPTIDRLNRHFTRYESDKPVIIKVSSLELMTANENVEFCRLNSGATRCHPSYGGNAPTRGKNTFLKPDLYLDKIGSVAEVTFRNLCKLPNDIWTGNSPEGRWKKWY